MDTQKVRVRFAPSPTGIMHLGNIRTALFNYLFAKQKKGVFILRIEDTDPERIFDPHGNQIIADLNWLGLEYDEGPKVEGPHKPYYQSQRSSIYQEKLTYLQNKNLIYRCFCSSEELAKKRERQRALKKPSRYDRTCSKLSPQEIEKNVKNAIPYIWRFNITNYTTVSINDLARGVVAFDLAHFSDFPLTRQNGSFTFLFANAVDDIVMNISHVLRGEDHLSNTANQAVLYQALNAPLPVFWHMPILCNKEGKKLSKRDFGFSLHNLQKNGYVPEAINNYLGIIGSSYTQEIMSFDELAKAFNFETVHAASGIKYDIEKLRWVNHKWIERYKPKELTNRSLPFLNTAFPTSKDMKENIITKLMQVIKSELITLSDIQNAAKFYFIRPDITQEDILQIINKEQGKKLATFLIKYRILLPDINAFLTSLKKEAQSHDIASKYLFAVLRLTLTGTTKGPRIHDIMELLKTKEVQQRLETSIKLLS